MKWFASPLAAPLALVLTVTGISLQQSGWFAAAASPPPAVRSTDSDPFASEAFHRHRTGQARHWRSMVLSQ